LTSTGSQLWGGKKDEKCGPTYPRQAKDPYSVAKEGKKKATLPGETLAPLFLQSTWEGGVWPFPGREKKGKKKWESERAVI